MNDPIISIVLPVYNAEKTINDTCGVYTIWGGSKKMSVYCLILYSALMLSIC